MTLKPGRQERLITEEVAEALDRIAPAWIERRALSDETAAELLTRHVADFLRVALRNAPKRGDSRVPSQLQLANELVRWLAERCDLPIDPEERIRDPGELLRSLLTADDVHLSARHPPAPLVPLRQSELIVNGPRDIRLGHLVERELPSADGVDLIIAFLKHSGVRMLVDELRRFVERRPKKLRVLTTTYLAATDILALRTLQDLGAEIRISYDAKTTRLHAKSWIFHRDNGFSTAVVGSSNLSASAMLDGREWNVRVSQVDNAVVFKKLTATFDQYWDDGTFEPFDEHRFFDAIDAQKRRNDDLDQLARVVRPKPYPHQLEVLDSIAAERVAGYQHNLVVAATGTGKTMVAAFDFKRIREERPDASLLFVAHRKEILRQSLAMFRAVLQDGDFGRTLEHGRPLERDRHVFAPIQAMHADRLSTLRPDAYDVLIVDEFHHAEAKSYRALLDHLQPAFLIGLTATPERADGRDVLHHFDDRVAAELRLWDALDLGLLSPFQYFGVHDGVDLRAVDFRSGRYDVTTLENIYTADHVRARTVLRATADKVGEPTKMRALGFCVSVAHADFMARYFTEHGVPALSVHSKTADAIRNDATRRLARREVNVLFTVDLFNEGVDLPTVDTVLFLRPTESATVFLQQLGRGLRRADDKDCLTVLDFIGNASRKFRFDRRFGALIRGTRKQIEEAVSEGFPHLPGGCEIQLDHESQAIVLENIRSNLSQTKRRLAEDLRSVGDVGLRAFLAQADASIDDVYAAGGSYTELLHRAGLRNGSAPGAKLRRALSRALHVDDVHRLRTWRGWLAKEAPPTANPDERLQLMLYAVLGHGREPVDAMQATWDTLWASVDLCAEIHALFGLLIDRLRAATYPLPDLPLHVHATYSRPEIMGAIGAIGASNKLLSPMIGVFEHAASRSELLFVTLDKDDKEFTPTTMYDDYPLSAERFHWQSQGLTRADSPRGLRYQSHDTMGWRMLLFVRQRSKERGNAVPFTFLGPVHYESHEKEKPMSIVWRLERPIPPAMWNAIKIAGG